MPVGCGLAELGLGRASMPPARLRRTRKKRSRADPANWLWPPNDAISRKSMRGWHRLRVSRSQLCRPSARAHACKSPSGCRSRSSKAGPLHEAGHSLSAPGGCSGWNNSVAQGTCDLGSSCEAGPADVPDPRRPSKPASGPRHEANAPMLSRVRRGARCSLSCRHAGGSRPGGKIFRVRAKDQKEFRHSHMVVPS